MKFRCYAYCIRVMAEIADQCSGCVMDRQSLEQEFEYYAAKMRFKLLTEPFMSGHDLLVLGTGAIIGGGGKEIGEQLVRFFGSTGQQLWNSKIFPILERGQLEPARRVVDFINNSLLPSVENREIPESPRVGKILESSIDSVELNDNQEVVGVLDQLIEETFSLKNPPTKKLVLLNKCCKILSELDASDLGILAINTAMSSVVTSEFPKFLLERKGFRSGNNAIPEVNEIVDRLNSLLRPIPECCFVFSESSYNFLLEQGCLAVVLESDKGIICIDLQQSERNNVNNSLSMKLIHQDARYSNYIPTETGKVLGYFALRYLCRYDGPFYGFEDWDLG